MYTVYGRERNGAWEPLASADTTDILKVAVMFLTSEDNEIIEVRLLDDDTGDVIHNLIYEPARITDLEQVPVWVTDLLGMLAVIEREAHSHSDIDIGCHEAGYELAKTVWTYQKEILGKWHPLNFGVPLSETRLKQAITTASVILGDTSPAQSTSGDQTPPDILTSP